MSAKVDKKAKAKADHVEDTKKDQKAEVKKLVDMEAAGEDLEVSILTQKTGWSVKTAPKTSVDDKSILDKPLTNPRINKIDLFVPPGKEIGTVRNTKGVTILDAMTALHKSYKNVDDDMLPEPYLAGFEWDKEENFHRLVVHLSKDAGAGAPGGKKKKKGGDE